VLQDQPRDRNRNRIRTGKDCGIGRFPSFDFAVNAAWLTASLIAAALLAWLQHFAIDGEFAKTEPKTLRLPHPAHRRPPVGFQNSATSPDLTLCGPVVLADEAAEDGSALDPLLGEISDGVVGPGGR
jgi:hypothetical protein